MIILWQLLVDCQTSTETWQIHCLRSVTIFSFVTYGFILSCSTVISLLLWLRYTVTESRACLSHRLKHKQVHMRITSINTQCFDMHMNQFLSNFSLARICLCYLTKWKCLCVCVGGCWGVQVLARCTFSSMVADSSALSLHKHNPFSVMKVVSGQDRTEIGI